MNEETKKDQEKKSKEIQKRLEKGRVTLDTMTAVGKKVKIAGREYVVAPITIMDMDILDTNIILPINKEDEIDDVSYAINIIDKDRARIFYYIVEKYTKFGDDKIPVTEKLINEHNWSIKDIKHFLQVWLQISD